MKKVCLRCRRPIPPTHRRYCSTRCYQAHKPREEYAPDPTEAEIAAATEAIRADWDEDEEFKRRRADCRPRITWAATMTLRVK